MKNNKREMLLTSLVCLLPLFVGAALYPRLPETMATHWDFSGNANGWSSRAATVFGLPLFILALHLVCFYAESRETKKNRNPVLRTVLLWFCPAISLLGGAVTLGTGLGYEMPISTVVPVFMGLLFLILGNYLPKIRQNRTMGIKLPWTLASEENWTRTHRVAGFTWVAAGLLMLLSALLRLHGPTVTVVLLALVLSLAACGAAPSSSATSSPSQISSSAAGAAMPADMPWQDVEPLTERITLNVALLANTLPHLPTYIAQEKGWLGACGIEVNPVVFKNGPSMAEAVGAGAWDCGSTGIGGVITGVLKSRRPKRS